MYRGSLRENVAVVPHPNPREADSEMELSTKGALGINICERAEEEEGWAEGEVQLQCRPDDSVSDPQGALERPFRVRLRSLHALHWSTTGCVPSERGMTWAAGASPGELDCWWLSADSTSSSRGNKSRDWGDRSWKWWERTGGKEGAECFIEMYCYLWWTNDTAAGFQKVGFPLPFASTNKNIRWTSTLKNAIIKTNYEEQSF